MAEYERHKHMANLKDVPSGNKGLGKLPTPVRNKMGYKAYGGKAKKKKMMGGGKVHKKMYRETKEVS